MRIAVPQSSCPARQALALRGARRRFDSLAVIGASVAYSDQWQFRREYGGGSADLVELAAPIRQLGEKSVLTSGPQNPMFC